MRQLLANIISLSRIPMGLFVVLFRDNRFIVFSLICLAVFSDWLDGRIAKGSRFGAFLDPFCDRFFVLLVGLSFIVPVGWFFVLLFFARDIFTLFGFFVCLFIGFKNIKARLFGKFVTVSQFVTLGFLVLGFSWAKYFIFVVAFLSVLAVVEYIWWFKHEIVDL